MIIESREERAKRSVAVAQSRVSDEEQMPHNETCWRQVDCIVCGKRKKPIGRDAPTAMANSLCDHECPGYYRDPQPPHYWSKEEVEE